MAPLIPSPRTGPWRTRSRTKKKTPARLMASGALRLAALQAWVAVGFAGGIPGAHAVVNGQTSGTATVSSASISTERGVPTRRKSRKR